MPSFRKCSSQLRAKSHDTATKGLSLESGQKHESLPFGSIPLRRGFEAGALKDDSTMLCRTIFMQKDKEGTLQNARVGSICVAGAAAFFILTFARTLHIRCMHATYERLARAPLTYLTAFKCISGPLQCSVPYFMGFLSPHGLRLFVPCQCASTHFCGACMRGQGFIL